MKYLTTPQLGEILGLSRTGITSQYKSWSLQPAEQVGSSYLWKPADVRRFLRERKKEQRHLGRPSTIDCDAALERLRAWEGR